MKYLLYCLIEGDAKKRHLKICRDLKRKFGIRQVIKDGIPSHITLKYTFSTDKIRDIEKLIESFCSYNKRSSFKLSGYGNFWKKAIFIEANPSKVMMTTHKKLIKELKKIKWMRWHDLEKTMHFHLSVAHTDMKEKDFPKVMAYLKKYKINQTVYWDNISIVQKKNHRWTVYKKYLFKK